ncbi:uncharacterized protein VICG_00764 [Vittaforma corneae ATCC 50505]|uniref:CNH domain-containing protein n=1 Tax=Vittaforma corneae (strain ATCC 50505) TaxID=993615 RepID=L2GML3_VITCO|nr:uncharacterized protein VICG_00764 [Vittaforma corneae ATCC 50505]ELA42123.1 hypothetical protein VICG_00764 [Vittaforma corneae ATCC 50505]
MCILELKKFLSFTYRNSNSLASFDVSKDFVFIITQTHIHQYCFRSPIPLACRLTFVPVFGCFYKDRYFLASKAELYYFKYSLHSLYKINALAHTFFYKNNLITVDDRVLIYKICENGNDKCLSLENPSLLTQSINSQGKETTDFDIEFYKECSILNSSNGMVGIPSDSNGLCSAHCIFEDKIFLGFENGIVGAVDGESLTSRACGTRLRLNVVEYFKDPVLTICVDDRFMFIHTLSYVFRIQSNNESMACEKKIFTEIKARKMLKYKEILVLVQDKRLLFVDLDLKISKAYLSLFDIRDAKIVDDSLFVGCTNGLLCEYNVREIHSK